MTEKDISTDPNTAELVARARTGDTEAFCELVETCQANIRAYIARFVNHDHDDVLDLAQETFVTAFNRLESFDPAQPFYPWVRGIARNVALQFLRKSGRRRRRETMTMEDLLGEWSASRLEQNHRADLDYIVELRECLKKLAQSASEMVRLRYFEQCSITEVARNVGRPEGTVRTLIMRIRRTLRECIEHELALKGAAE